MLEALNTGAGTERIGEKSVKTPSMTRLHQLMSVIEIKDVVFFKREPAMNGHPLNPRLEIGWILSASVV
jgi:hypothetical protein